jgi:hypothetical protein
MIDLDYLAIAHDLYFILSCIFSNDISFHLVCFSIGIVLLGTHYLLGDRYTKYVQDRDDANRICTRNKKSVVTF